ncbi:EamA family transporter [Pseudomonas sp. MWU16-30317]|uniref:DMT family transporter n=1 Tax=Pseudomonas sp. MWU16-30317 TaxID=2878095 RepID=UPI001CF9FA4B
MPTIVLFIGAALIWGSTYFAITFQLGQVDPTVSVVYRFAIASSSLFVWCALRGDRLWLNWKTQRWLIFQGVTTFGITYVGVYHAERYLLSGLMSVLFVLVVFWSPVFERIVFGKPLTWHIFSAAAVAGCGVIMMCSQTVGLTWVSISSGKGGAFFIGLGLALSATLTFAMGGVSAVKIRQSSSNSMLTLAWAMFWGAFSVALWVALTGTEWRLPTETSYWVSLCYLSLFGSVLTFSALFTLIHRIGAQKAMYIEVVTPAIAVLLSMR